MSYEKQKKIKPCHFIFFGNNITNIDRYKTFHFIISFKKITTTISYKSYMIKRNCGII